MRRAFRRFHLNRTEDVSGTSGTGIVAEGVVFSTGKTVLNWTVAGKTSVAIYDSLDAMVGIHGHDGRTTVKYVDDESGGPVMYFANTFSCAWCSGDGSGDHAVDCAKRQTHPLDPRQPAEPRWMRVGTRSHQIGVPIVHAFYPGGNGRSMCNIGPGQPHVSERVFLGTARHCKRCEARMPCPAIACHKVVNHGGPHG